MRDEREGTADKEMKNDHADNPDQGDKAEKKDKEQEYEEATTAPRNVSHGNHLLE